MKDLNYYLSKIRSKEDAIHILMTMCCDCDRRLSCTGAESDKCNRIKEAIVDLYKEDSKVHKTDSNKVMQTEDVSSYFVIIADRDGVRKYVSKVFPRTFQYTVKMTHAQRFYSREHAQTFIDGFNDYGKYVIDNPEIREVHRTLELVENKVAVSDELSLDYFLKGNYSINCTTAAEATELFRWLRTQGVIWKTNSPLTDTNWSEYKEKTIYLMQYKKLSFWGKDEEFGVDIVVAYGDIANQLVIPKQDFKEDITYAEFTNQYAVWCETEEEARELYEKLGKQGVKAWDGWDTCDRSDTDWFMDTEKTAYTLWVDTESVKRIYPGNVDTMRNMGYHILRYAALNDL